MISAEEEYGSVGIAVWSHDICRPKYKSPCVGISHPWDASWRRIKATSLSPSRAKQSDCTTEIEYCRTIGEVCNYRTHRQQINHYFVSTQGYRSSISLTSGTLIHAISTPAPNLTSSHQSHGKSPTSTLVQVKYPKPPGPKLPKSSSKKFRMSGLTTSDARCFSSSTLLSNRLKLSRV